MVKFSIDSNAGEHRDASNVSWVSKRSLSSKDSQSCIALHFHKITPEVKDHFVRNSRAEDLEA